jgi:hypothetical protein
VKAARSARTRPRQASWTARCPSGIVYSPRQVGAKTRMYSAARASICFSIRAQVSAACGSLVARTAAFAASRRGGSQTEASWTEGSAQPALSS